MRLQGFFAHKKVEKQYESMKIMQKRTGREQAGNKI
jgi:hypothetical protein